MGRCSKRRTKITEKNEPKNSQTAESMAAASNSPAHPEPNPSPAVCQSYCQEPNIQLFHFNQCPNIKIKIPIQLQIQTWLIQVLEIYIYMKTFLMFNLTRIVLIAFVSLIKAVSFTITVSVCFHTVSIFSSERHPGDRLQYSAFLNSLSMGG